jgi:hypothetical protein
MKRKRDWLALVEYMDGNQKIKQILQFAFNPKTLSGLAKMVSVMSKEIFRSGHR